MLSNEYSLDTNIVLRFLLRDIPEQAVKAANLIATAHCYVTDVVVTETIFVLEKVYETPRRDIASLLRSFLEFPNVVYNTYLMDDVITMFEKHSSLSIIDCYSAIEAKVFNNKLATFDRKLINQGGQHVIAP